MNDEKLLNAVSDITAQALNQRDFGEVGQKLAALFPAGASEAEKDALIDRAVIYAMQAHQPGFPPDGRPGYFSASMDLKAAVLDEIDVMARVDPDDDVDQTAWEKLKKSLQDAQETDFTKGADIFCPDDYVLTVQPISCGLMLRQYAVWKKDEDRL